MNPQIATLVQKLRRMEAELGLLFATQRTELAFTVQERAVRFEQRVLQRHRQIRTRLASYLGNTRPLLVITAPIIYALIVPLCLLDLFVTIYQAVCFPVYGIAPVARRDYLVFDRASLAYLNIIEKFNCLYCSYANGLIAHVREIASRTEQYWCPIKHARRVAAMHDRYWKFADYGDAENFHAELETLRVELRAQRAAK